MKNKIFLISLALILLLHPENEVKTFGFYSNEKSNDGEHSIGYTLQLWRYKNTLVGKVSYNEALIGDHSSGFISNVKYDPKRKTLSFDSILGKENVSFSGKIISSRISGAFTWARHKDQNQSLKSCCKDAEINKDYLTLSEWKKMWQKFE